MKQDKMDIPSLVKRYKRLKELDTRNYIIEACLPIVKRIAEALKKTLPPCVDIHDLEEAGTFGLMDSLEGFNPKRGVRFTAYCTIRIRGAMLDSLREFDWVPRHFRFQSSKLRKARAILEDRLGRAPTDEELAAELKLSIKRFTRFAKKATTPCVFSLYRKRNPGFDTSEDTQAIVDERSPDPAKEFFRRSEIEDVLSAVSKLDERKRNIVKLCVMDGLTLKQAGPLVGLSESGVCLNRGNIILELQAMLTA